MVWKVSSSGGTPRVFPDTELSHYLAWAPGPDILYQQPGNRNLGVLDSETGEKRLLVPEGSPGWMFSAHYSPDGKRVAMACNRPAGQGLWVTSLEDSSETFLAPTLYPVGWSPDGAWIYAKEWNKKGGISDLVMVPARGGDPELFMNLPLDGVSEISIAPDGKYVVCNVSEYRSDVWLMENFDPEVR